MTIINWLKKIFCKSPEIKFKNMDGQKVDVFIVLNGGGGGGGSKPLEPIEDKKDKLQ